MARQKKIPVVLCKDKAGKEWVATATEGARVEARHLDPTIAINRLSELLRREFGDDIQVEYEMQPPPRMQALLDTLKKEEEELKELTQRVKMRRYEIASEGLINRIKQQHIAEMLHLSQSYVNNIIKTKGQITETGTGERILSSRRRT